jgi:hypothetical protein
VNPERKEEIEKLRTMPMNPERMKGKERRAVS